MKTIIRYEGKEYIETNSNEPIMSNDPCACGNPMYVPLAVIVLGLVDSCSHCGKDYPFKAHCHAVTESYLGLIEGEEIVEL